VFIVGAVDILVLDYETYSWWDLWHFVW